jgi:hypothetical protein
VVGQRESEPERRRREDLHRVVATDDVDAAPIVDGEVQQSV